MSATDRFRNLKLRDWNDFVETGRFKLPDSPEKMKTRVFTNLNYYAVNYLAIGLIFLLLVMFFRPLIVIVVFIVVAGIFGLSTQRNSMAEKQFYGAGAVLVVVATLLLIFLGGIVTMIFFSLYGIVVLGHACCRCRSTKSKFAAKMNHSDPNAEDFKHSFNVISSEISSMKNDFTGNTFMKRPSVEAAKAKYHKLSEDMKEKYDLGV